MKGFLCRSTLCTEKTVEFFHLLACTVYLDQHGRGDKLRQGITLAELLIYIDEARMDEDVAPIFKL